MVKTFVDDSQGNEQVLGFALPGEVIGLNAIHGSRFPCNAVALDTVHLCRISFPKLSLLATRMPGLQAKLFSLLSAETARLPRWRPTTAPKSGWLRSCWTCRPVMRGVVFPRPVST